MLNRILVTFVALAAIAWASALYVTACPFCSAINLTFSDQIKANDIVVIAKLMEIAAAVDDPDAEIPKSQFEVVNVIKGQEFVATGAKFRSLLIGRYPIGQEFLVMGVDPPLVAWSTPMKASGRVVQYLERIQQLPERGPDRLEFFQNYFEDKESVLAFDAYDEFAKAPYEEIIALKDKLNRDQLVGWIKDPNTSINRRRLYLTLLGVCGQAEDVKMLEDFIKSGDRKKQAGLDALIACYLTLHGEKGVALVEDTFLRDQTVEYVDTLAAVSALRFHGTETKKIPQQRIVAAIRLLLDRPKMADMIIPDLARWEDWSVMDRLVKMFKEADEETVWLRVPVISYLRACPDPKAKTYIAELKEIDPDAVRRADFFLDFEDEEEDDQESDTEPAEKAGSGESSKDSFDASGGEQPVSTIASGDWFSAADPVDDPASNPHTVRRITLSEAAPSETASSGTSNTSRDPAVSSIGDESIAKASNPDVSVPTPVAATQSPALSATWQIVFIPMLISIAIFVLLWSVIHGWFERLIF